MVKIINSAFDKPLALSVEFKDVTLEELFNELEINKLHVGAVLVNGIPKKLTEKITDNSVIHILPVLSGG